MSEETPEAGADSPALGRQLLQLRQELAQLRRRLHALADASTVADLTGQLATLNTRVTALEALAQQQGSGEEDEPALWDWQTLLTDENGEAGQQAKAELAEWVETVLTQIYGLVAWQEKIDLREPSSLRKIPPCWDKHTDLVLDLAWLGQEWSRIYRTSYGTPARAGDWHDRYLPGLRRRLPNSSASGCISKHPDPNARPL
ncbi:hypothetical protein AB0F17_65790 [Nonomuraea sp. NPDC026600]|uniref:hypothetical protein n=1 Tax=Nonomuraea sp. NPDC026600 TaxID=3155363 RepID=UPI0033D34C73